jgi:Tol biopolymer transport system component
MTFPLVALVLTLTAAEGPRWVVREAPLCPGAEIAGATPDLKHFACVVKRGKLWQVDVDGRAGTPFNMDRDHFSGVRFSEDGQRFAYLFKDDGRWHVVVDGVEVGGSKGARWFQVGAIGFQFTEDSRRWFFAAGRSADGAGIGGAVAGPVGALVGSLFSKTPEFVFVVDGEVIAEGVRTGLVNRDGSRLLYVVERAGAAGTRVPTLVVRALDGTETAHSGVSCDGEGPCAFSPDGARLAYALRRDHGWSMDVDGLPGKAYEAVGAPTFSADGKRLAYPAKKSGKWMVVTDVVEGPAYDQVASPVAFTRDGRRQAYAAQTNGKWAVVVDGVQSEPYDETGPIYFGPGGTRIAYGGKTAGRWSMVEGGAVGKPYQRLYPPVFSAAGARMAYGGRHDGKHVVVIDGVEGPPFDDLGEPAFSPDGEHVAYAAKRDGKWSIVVDGVAFGEYRLEWNGKIAFDGPSKLYALARGREKQQMLRLEAELQP